MSKDKEKEVVKKDSKTSAQRDDARKVSDEHVFVLFMERFDTLEEQNKEQLKLLTKHIEEDSNVHAVVAKHTTYFKIAALGIPAVVAIGLSKLGLKV